MEKKQVLDLLSRQTLISVGTSSNNRPDNSIVCFAFDEHCNLYFGSYSDTLKCKNICINSLVAITTGTLQIHGKAVIVPYGTKEYEDCRFIYDDRFPKYKEVFELEKNELYKVTPLVIWNYNPSKGEMHRDLIVFDKQYYDSLDVYEPHHYDKRKLEQCNNMK